MTSPRTDGCSRPYVRGQSVLTCVERAPHHGTSTVSAADAVDGDSIVLSASNLPAGAVFATVTNAGTVSNTFVWNNVSPMGVYTTTFWAVDKDGADSETIAITIGDGSGPVRPVAHRLAHAARRIEDCRRPQQSMLGRERGQHACIGSMSGM